MSDTSQGAGWWQASDNKWYPPEQFPDELEMPPEVAAALAAKAEQAAPPPVPPAPVPEADATAVTGTDPGGPPTEAIDTPPLTRPDPAERPTSVFAAPTAGEPTTAVPSAPPQGWGDTTTAYAAPSVPAEVAAPAPAIGSNVPAAVVALIGAALAIIGSFLEWAKPTQDGDVVLPPGIANITVPSFDGLDSNGVGTLICGVVMAIVAGVLLTKVRHVMLMVALVVAGVVAVGLFLYSFIDISGLDIKINGNKVEGIGFDPGVGLWVVLGGGVLSIVAGLLVKRS